ncbi:GTPase Era [sulfur-oxidizing endosymbiont of Gigantopelta aegis]|uniref:GTPase Era n=1 Tax=sulfur-oxidizing endosymbiont of Gigantopelta aegis TaxID=2794934 RepID=UPI0018DCC29F|nr:GTPase Era [sulfur-oxidizing endosymbiont of Gigantopelta aegis]
MMTKTEYPDNYRSGYVAIIGRPNVGKSTLLNYILGFHLSITSKKPQTTRHRLLGIKTTKTAQSVYIDTPGLHQKHKGAIHTYMNKEAMSTLNDVDVIVFVVDGIKLTEEDEYVIELLKPCDQPIILAVNKVDKIKDKEILLPFLEQLSQRLNFAHIVPVSAAKGKNVAELEAHIESDLNLSPAYFPEEQITDKSDRFLASELIREKLMRLLGQEVPYAIAVEVEAFEEEEKIIKISAVIWVERRNQKSIIIGHKGQQLKEVGKQARKSMEHLYDKKVFLKLWVKVKDGWSDDQKALKSLGYFDYLKTDAF